MTEPTGTYDNLDAMIDLAIKSHRYEMATGMLLATIEIASDDLTEDMKQQLGEKLIELQIKHYAHMSAGTKDILALAGFDDETVKEILTNAKTKSNERGTD